MIEGVFSTEPAASRETAAVTSRPHTGHRADIEGLRAVAVMSVLLFHADFPLVGGYLGVDVFFVISGYLITRNITTDIQNGRFAYTTFYMRRLRRIFPALAVTLVLTLIGAFLCFAPEDMARTGESALFSVLSLSNVLFWRQISYFDAAATVKPLLHTWSLAVEEQFYLIWPALLVSTARLGGRYALRTAVLVVGIASFASAELLRGAHPGAVFYLMPFRMFELCAGAILAFFPDRRPGVAVAEASTGAGLAAIVYAVAVFDSTYSLRRGWSLLPVAGAMLVISSGGSSTSGWLLSNRIATWVGNISYSLYLAHWPIVVFYRYLHPSGLSLVARIVLVVLSVMVAAVSYKFVEQPFRLAGTRRNPAIGKRPMIVSASLTAAVLVLAGFSAWQSGGWRFRLPSELRTIPTETAMWLERNPAARVGSCFIDPNAPPFFDERGCLATNPDKPNYLIVGDSLAADAYVYLSTAYPDINFLQATSGNCRPLIDGDGDEPCKALRDLVFNRFLPGRTLDGIVLGGGWQLADLDRLEATIDRLRAESHRVFVVGAGVRFPANVSALIFQSRRLSKAGVEQDVAAHIQPFEFTLNQIVRQRVGPKVEAYVDVQTLMCEDRCRLFTPEGKMIYVDFAHLTLAGSRYLAGKIGAQYPTLFSSAARGPRTRDPAG